MARCVMFRPRYGRRCAAVAAWMVPGPLGGPVCAACAESYLSAAEREAAAPLPGASYPCGCHPSEEPCGSGYHHA